MQYLMDLIKTVVPLLVVVSTAAGAGYLVGKKSGIVEGHNTALSTNPVSEDLEMTCAALWVGEQNKEYWKQHNKK